VNDESKGEREREREREREQIYDFSRTNFLRVVCKMHYRRERNDFGCLSNVQRNKVDLFQIDVFIKIWNVFLSV
jgi:hypothetical protein